MIIDLSILSHFLSLTGRRDEFELIHIRSYFLIKTSLFKLYHNSTSLDARFDSNRGESRRAGACGENLFLLKKVPGLFSFSERSGYTA